MKNNLAKWSLLAPVLLLLGGCAYLTERKQEREMEMVARRWCMTIRASQIIPTYPLNEDIQPGDVFIVETPAQRQASDYNKKGYLDLEHLLVRLKTSAYSDFYAKSYEIGDFTNTPHHWQFPTNTWTNAPLAGFPSYSVDIKKGGGFNAAFPISGIPVGLSYVGSAQAKVNVQLAKAHTFGLDQASLEAPFRKWITDNPNLVLQYARPTNQTAYLRLITRVFLVESVNVNVSADDSSGFSGSGGASKKVNIPILQDTNAVANYTNSIGKLSEMIEGLSESAPGGTLKLASASSRSITMNEKFARPLVIGYIAQDYPIFADGTIKGPVSTKDVLEGRTPDPLQKSKSSLYNEQAVAKLVANECISKLSTLTPDQMKRTLDSAVGTDILSDQEKAKINAKGDPKEALQMYSDALLRKARSGDVRARCDLNSFFDVINHLKL